MLDTTLQDLRYGFRMFLKRPWLTAVAVFTLALGIGASTAIFTVVDGVLLRPLPYAEPGKLVMFWCDFVNQDMFHIEVSPPEFVDYKNRLQSFSSIAAYATQDVNLSEADGPEQVQATYATAGLFETLGVAPRLGRSFTAEEDRPGNEQVVVLGDGLWRRRFGADPGVLGKTVLINAKSYTVVGVASPGFAYPRDTDLWLPMAFSPDDLSESYRGSHFLETVGRLEPGVTFETAEAELATLAGTLREEHPDTYRPANGWTARMTTLEDETVKTIRPALLVLLAGVGFVLLIVFANVANIMLVRTSGRGKEIAVRMALGAGRARITRQLVVESLLLALVGGALGVILAVWGVDALLAVSPDDVPRAHEIGLSWRVLAFAGGLSVVGGIAFGLLASLRLAGEHQAESLKDGGRGSSESRKSARVRGALVVVEVALALVLLVGSGLFARSFANLWNVDTGFQADGVLTIQLSLPRASYSDAARVNATFREVLDRTKALPGVRAVGLTNGLPLDGGNSGTTSVEGRPATSSDASIEADWRVVSPDYFEALGIDLVDGRALQETDAAEGEPVTVVDETFARKYFPNGQAVGRRLKRGDADSPGPWIRVVGVVRHVRNEALDDEGHVQAYFPYSQLPYGDPVRTMSFVVRTDGDPVALRRSIEAIVQGIDPNLPVARVRTMRQIVSASVASQRLAMLLLGVFGVVALLLSVVGIAGVISYSVTQRTHEIGIRMALGAIPRDVLKLVVAQGMLFAGVGVLLGLPIALGATRAVSSLLFGVSPIDPTTFLGAAALLVAAAFVASLLPSLRASRVDPVVALREQ